LLGANRTVALDPSRGLIRVSARLSAERVVAAAVDICRRVRRHRDAKERLPGGAFSIARQAGISLSSAVSSAAPVRPA